MTKSEKAHDLVTTLFAHGQGGRAVAALKDLLGEVEAVRKASTAVGKAKGGGQSSKAKGRAAVQQVRELLLEAFPSLGPDDVAVRATSQVGTDVHLSESAKQCFPFAIEVKNVEKFNPWAALAQAEANSTKKGLAPVVFFKRARSRMYVALGVEDFLSLFQGK